MEVKVVNIITNEAQKIKTDFIPHQFDILGKYIVCKVEYEKLVTNKTTFYTQNKAVIYVVEKEYFNSLSYIGKLKFYYKYFK